MVRRVRTTGEIKWRGEFLLLGEALRGEPVGLLRQDDRYFAICFGPLQIGVLDDYARKALKTPIKVLPMFPDSL